MSTKKAVDIYTRRQELLKALSVSPLDSRQICSLSQIFIQPFSDECYVRRAMNRSYLKDYVLEFAFPDKLKYWRLSKLGYQVLNGHDAILPRRTAFKPISPSRERHVRGLADLLVRLQVAAFERGIEVSYVYGDGQITLTHGMKSKVPDAVIGFKMKNRTTYSLVIEFDCSTEPIYSNKQRDSLNKTIEFYLGHEASLQKGSYRVAMIFDHSTSRHLHFLEQVERLNNHPNRRTIKAGILNQLLEHDDPLMWPVLINEDRQRSAILPGRKVNAQTIPAPILDVPVFAC